MAAERLRTAALLVVLATTAVLTGSCGDGTTAPEDFGRVSFTLVSGDGQSGPAGTELPKPVVVKVTKPNGGGLAGVTVNFRVTSGGGSVYAGSATTGHDGLAQDYWTLGPTAGEPQRLQVRAVSSSGEKQVFGEFNATALSGTAAHIVLHAGDGQTASTSFPVPIAPAVRVTDEHGSPVGGVAVVFEVDFGGGSITGGSATSDNHGIARVGSWTLGPGINTLTATASAEDIIENPVTFVATGEPGNVWTIKTPMPTAREAPGVAALNGMLYAAGGGSALATFEAYNPATDSWIAKRSMPTGRYGPGVVAIKGKLYAVGGQGSAGPVAALEVYDPVTNSWATKAPMPTARYFFGASTINGKLYVVGGLSNSGALGTVEVYDPATNTWSTRTSMPTPRYALATAAINGILYAVGGSSGPVLTTVEAYDPVSDTWTTKTPMPTARWVLAAAELEGNLYALGGLANGPLATVEAYVPATDSWTAKPPMPTARLGPGAVSVGEILYVVGGHTFTPSRAVEAYRR